MYHHRLDRMPPMGIRTPPNGVSPHVSPYATPAPISYPQGGNPGYYFTSMSRGSSAGVGAAPNTWSPQQNRNARLSTDAAAGPSYHGTEYNGNQSYNDEDDEDEEDDDDEDDDDEGDEDDDDDEDEDGNDDDDDDDDDDDGGDESTSAANLKGKRKRGKGNGHDARDSPNGRSGSYAKSPDGSEQQGGRGKPKPPRGSKACTHCRKLKMRCTGGENGPPCDRCRHSGYTCVFEESNRGKKAAANAAKAAKAKAEKAAAAAAAKAEAAAAGAAAAKETAPFTSKGKGKGKQSYASMVKSMGEMQEILKSVLKAFKDPNHAQSLGHASGFLTRPHSPEREEEEVAVPARNHPVTAISPPTSIAPEQLTGSKPSSSKPEPSNTHAARYATLAPSVAGSIASGSTASASLGSPSSHSRSQRPVSPRLHSLPPDSLNPLGLLAEASLGNQMSSSRRSRADGRHRSVGVDGRSPGEASSSGQQHRLGQLKEEPDEHADGKKNGEDAPALGVASQAYFRPGPMSMLPLRKVIIDRELPPELLTSGTVSDAEVLDLFSIFFHNCAQHIILLDPEWHTPHFVCGRSPFLFTVILAIASRYYTPRPDLHAKCLQQATKEAFRCLEKGYKSVEIVQAFLLLTMWGQPARRFEEDKSWIFAGIAIRVATDLSLHRKSNAMQAGQNHAGLDAAAVLEREKEIRNRERTWIFCYVVDKNLSSQMGKPSIIREDYIINNTKSWMLERQAHPADVALSAITELCRVTSRQVEILYSTSTKSNGFSTELDFGNLVRVFHEQLEEWRDYWSLRGVMGRCSTRPAQFDGSLSPREMQLAQIYAAANLSEPPPDDADHTVRTVYYLIQQAPLRYYYASLTIHSFGLQFGAAVDRAVFFHRCYEAAKGIYFAARDGMRPILRYASDTQILVISFSLVFMLKLTRPTFNAYADCDEIFRLAEEGINMLQEVAASPIHTPALYAQFLRATWQHAKAQKMGQSTFPSRNQSPQPGHGLGQPTGPMISSSLGAGGHGPFDSEAAAAFGLHSEHAKDGADPTLSKGTRHNSISEATLNAFGLGLPFDNPLSSLPGSSDAPFASAASAPFNTANGFNASMPFMGPDFGSNGGSMLENVWWSQLIPSGLDGLNGGIDMHPVGQPSSYTSPIFPADFGVGSGSNGSSLLPSALQPHAAASNGTDGTATPLPKEVVGAAVGGGGGGDGHHSRQGDRRCSTVAAPERPASGTGSFGQSSTNQTGTGAGTGHHGAPRSESAGAVPTTTAISNGNGSRHTPGAGAGNANGSGAKAGNQDAFMASFN